MSKTTLIFFSENLSKKQKNINRLSLETGGPVGLIQEKSEVEKSLAIVPTLPYQLGENKCINVDTYTYLRMYKG